MRQGGYTRMKRGNMPICIQCNNNFPSSKTIDGKRRQFKQRKLCLDCKPYVPGAPKTRTKLVQCDYCSQSFPKTTYDVCRTSHNYCSRTCFYKAKVTTGVKGFNKQTNRNCIQCGTQNITGQKYCSVTCRTNHKYELFIKQWQNGEIDGSVESGLDISHRLKRYIKNKFRNKCANCGWCKINSTTGFVPLEIDHIDGNWRNNKEDNLTLLCPNCHALTPTYRALNKGHGRYTIRKSLGKL